MGLPLTPPLLPHLLLSSRSSLLKPASLSASTSLGLLDDTSFHFCPILYPRDPLSVTQSLWAIGPGFVGTSPAHPRAFSPRVSDSQPQPGSGQRVTSLHRPNRVQHVSSDIHPIVNTLDSAGEPAANT